MSSKPPFTDLFGWSSKGLGLSVKGRDAGMIAHEDMFGEDAVILKEERMFVGPALPSKRFVFAWCVIGACIALLLGRAFWMQIVQGAAYQERAENNRLRHDVLIARRGVIRDRTGVVLAENVPAFDVRAVPWLLPKDLQAREDVLARVGREIGRNVSDLEAAIASSTDPAQEMTLARDISYERAVAANILLGDDPAIHIFIGSKRKYTFSPQIQSLSHILGYVGGVSPKDLVEGGAYRQTDVIGKTGVEATAEDLLKGKHGERVYEVDATNKVTSLVSNSVSVDGQDVRLTIDLRLQQAMDKALVDGMAKAHIDKGAAIAMDPRDGSILAIASLPAYDNNLFSGSVSTTGYKALLDNPSHPLLARAWAGIYPSGSTVKPVVATGALMEKIVTPNTSVYSSGGIKLGQTFFPDWKAGGHGATNVRRAIAWSVNTFFYTIGGGYEAFIGLGVDRLTDWMRRFGLGAKTGLDLPGENAGFVPSKEWKENIRHEHWYVGDTYNLSIGQGDLLVTPLQVAAFTSAVANGGVIVTPHVIQGHEQQTVNSSSTSVASAEALTTVRLGMRDTVVYGSGRALSTFPIPVAGKTGTAQWRNDKPNHAWFTSFAPFDKPEIVVTVFLEEGVEGSPSALPVARQILDAWLLGRK
ncbi:penicillin-binding protein 2 [Patescibacteria group bacterium]|nr:penicillin-binding protein 2 [Patescibacteria group bacterium]